MSRTRSGRSSRRRRESKSAAQAAFFVFPALALALCVAFAGGCASTAPRPPRGLPPADDALKARVLSAWGAALRRAGTLGPSRLLYDAKFGKGALKLPGTLAVYAGSESLTVKASGPFGVEVGSYEDGRYTGKAGEVSFLEPAVLRGVLAGVWRGGSPQVAGADSEEGLLRWEAAGRVTAEGRIDLAKERLRTLEVRGERGELRAEFSGAFDPWPEAILLVDERSGRSLKLRRVIVEPISVKDEPPAMANPKSRT